MTTRLFIWNPDRYSWGSFKDEIEASRSASPGAIRWSCSNNKNIRKEDRALLIRLGSEPRGIVGYGKCVADASLEPHWDRTKGGMQYFAEIEFFNELTETPILPLDVLKGISSDAFNWSQRSSGNKVPGALADRVFKLLDEASLRGREFRFAEELSPAQVYEEGRVTRIWVDRHERNPEARKACIKAHGSRCKICDFDFGSVYGELAEGFIHVHHLVPISNDSNSREIDPVLDLIPVCPNCHAVIHLASEPMAPEKVMSLIGQSRGAK